MGLHGLLFRGAEYPSWLAYAFDNPLRRRLQKPRQLLERYLQPGNVVVDLGCGFGYFTSDLAELVGPTGEVHAVDRQQSMLEHTRKTTERRGVSDRITFHLAPLRGAELVHHVDLVLAFWMFHEARGKRELLAEIHEALKPSGRLLLVEPVGHVSAATFQRENDLALEAGFIAVSEPKIALSRAVLLAPVSQR